jgi:hypothetical protein
MSVEDFCERYKDLLPPEMQTPEGQLKLYHEIKQKCAADNGQEVLMPLTYLKRRAKERMAVTDNGNQ